jgi:hypothetical protein
MVQIFCVFILISVQAMGSNQDVISQRITEINDLLQNHRTKDYFYKSRRLVSLMNEKECLQLMKDHNVLNDNGDCERSKENFPLAELAKEIDTLSQEQRECGLSRCAQVQNLAADAVELKKTYRIKLFEFLLKNFTANSQQLGAPTDCLKTTVNSQTIKCIKPKDGSLPLQMGINLTAPQAESPAIGNAVPFADIFKTARPFESDKPTLVKEKNGWPCFKQRGQKIKTHLLQSAMPGSVPDGIYPIHYSGDVNINISGASLINCPDGRIKTKNNLNRKCIEINIPNQLNAQGVSVEVEGNSAGACLEDLKIIMPGGSPNYEQQIESGHHTVVFNKDYLDYLKPFQVIRMMNLMYSSPRLPEACRKIQQKSIEQAPTQYSWNNLSPKAKDCTLDKTSNRTPSNRSKLSDATWGVSHDTDKRNWRGVPIEVATELIKQTGADPWINIPHNASKEYVRLMARSLAEAKKANPNIKIHVEYSNEVWNGRFWGAKFTQASTTDPHPESSRKTLLEELTRLTKEYQSKRTQAKDDHKKIKQITEHYNELMGPIRTKLNKKVEAEVRTYVDRSLEVFQVFEEVLGEETIVRTLGTNQKDPNRTKRMLTILKDEGKLDQVDSIATATYFHGCWGTSPNEGPQCRQYLQKTKKDGMYSVNTEEEALDLLLDPENPEGVHHVIEQVQKQQAVLDSDDFKEANIDLVAYEGGQHLTLDNMPADLKRTITPEKKKKLISLIHRANNHPKMGEIYRTLYDGWAKAGGKTHVNFIMAQSQSQYGSFGMSSSLGNAQDSAKYTTAQKYSEIYCMGEL